LAEKDLRVNEQIRVREVRLIRDEGEQQGIMSVSQALEIAREAGLDLVEVAPTAVPPVVKILDYGKFRFENEKRFGIPRKSRNFLSLRKSECSPRLTITILISNLNI